MDEPTPRQTYIAAKAAFDRIDARRERAWAPFRKEYEAAEAALDDARDASIATCETCLMPIFEGDLAHVGDDVSFCEKHAPLLSEGIQAWEDAVAADHDWWEGQFDSLQEGLDNIAKLKADLVANGDRKLLFRA